MTPDPKPQPATTTADTTADTQDGASATADVAAPKTTGAKVGDWVTKRVDKVLEVTEQGVHAAHRLADVAERAIDVTERVLHAAGHPAVAPPDKVIDADPSPSSTGPSAGPAAPNAKDATR